MSVHETLIEPAELHAHLGAHGWTIVDCRFDLSQTEAGRQAYRRGRIPGAHYAHLDEDLSGPPTATSGRHPLPDVRQLAARFGKWGIGESTQVIAYDDAGGAYAARLWWLLRWLGHRKVAVLNGGFKAWERAGLPIDRRGIEESPASPAKEFRPRIEPGAWLTAEEVAQGLATGEIALIDARGSDRFAGRNETIDPVAGHVPGARNYPYITNLDAEQRFLPATILRQRWNEALGGIEPRRVVSMCGSGVTACHNLLALQIAGFEGARLYAGSWSEWIRYPKRPIATGP